MEKLHKLFLKEKSKEESEDIMRISRTIGPLIDKATTDIFMSYREKLIAEPITYIVPAVWGANKEGELTSTQKEMNLEITPDINDIIMMLGVEKLNGSQKFAIEYIVRGLFITKITYMIALLKNQGFMKFGLSHKQDEGLNRMKPLGSA